MTEENTKPVVLVTNDDGVQSNFLWALVQALKVQFNVFVVAPDGLCFYFHQPI